MRKLAFKCHALLMTVLVATILSIICVFVIIIAYNNRREIYDIEAETKLNLGLFSARNALLADTSIYIYKSWKDLDLELRSDNSNRVVRSSWGFIQLANGIVRNKRESKECSFFIGCGFDSLYNSAIYLADHRRPLVFVGRGQVIGDLYVPDLGIQKGYIGGEGFEGDRFSIGSILKSKSNLPEFRVDVFRMIHESLNELYDSAIRINTSELLEYRTRSRSFSEKPVFLLSSDSVILRDINLSGNIVIRSNKHIEVDQSAKLEDIILVAPSIHFGKGFSGVLQAIAFDSLVCDSSNSFGYPSVLAVLEESGAGSSSLKIKGGSKVCGIVCLFSKEKGERLPNAIIEDDTEVVGLVYVKGYLSLEAKVVGCVITDYFLTYSQGVRYVNYLISPQIDRLRLDSNYLLPTGFLCCGNQKIVKTLQ